MTLALLGQVGAPAGDARSNTVASDSGLGVHIRSMADLQGKGLLKVRLTSGADLRSAPTEHQKEPEIQTHSTFRTETFPSPREQEGSAAVRYSSTTDSEFGALHRFGTRDHPGIAVPAPHRDGLLHPR